jgi:hypothetical protein
MAATERSEGFMTYKTGEARLRRALIPMLVGKPTGPVQGLFEIVFRP